MKSQSKSIRLKLILLMGLLTLALALMQGDRRVVAENCCTACAEQWDQCMVTIGDQEFCDMQRCGCYNNTCGTGYCPLC